MKVAPPAHASPHAAEPTDGPLTFDELALAYRNPAMPFDALRFDRTPIGLHYQLVHFDIPAIDPGSWRLAIGGRVRRPLSLGLDDLLARPTRTLAVTLECAGGGRGLLSPRPVSVPWLGGAIGTAEWTGTPLRALLDEAGLEDDGVDVVFTGADRGVQGDEEQWYERGLSVAEASHPDVLVAWAMNGQPLPPQHGHPARLVVPGWYGMASVKWLTSITVIDRPFEGFQQAVAYRYQASAEDPGEPVNRIRVRSLMVPPGIPDFATRARFVDPGPLTITGRAWSGQAEVVRAEVGVDGEWAEATLGPAQGPYAWRSWSFAWQATPGEHELASRATDAAGSVQPLEPPWNYQGMGNNAVQCVRVTVR